MADTNQILTLIKSHIDGDNERFKTTALQIADCEAKAGYSILARSINEVVESKRAKIIYAKSTNPTIGEFEGVIQEVSNSFLLDDLICRKEAFYKLNRVIREYLKREKLAKYNLKHRRKLLLIGPRGTGKKMTGSILSNEFHLPLFIVQMDKFLTRFQEDTTEKINRIFELIAEIPGVYVFNKIYPSDLPHGINEEHYKMQHIFNIFLQFMEQDESESFILATTNNFSLSGKGLFQHFDDVVEYELPNNSEKRIVLERQLSSLIPSSFDYDSVISLLYKMNYEEITMVCQDILKEALLNDRIPDLDMMRKAICFF